MVQNEHVRPKKRNVIVPSKTTADKLPSFSSSSSQKESNHDDLDALLEETRTKMNAWLGASGISTLAASSNKDDAKPTTPTLISETNYNPAEKAADPVMRTTKTATAVVTTTRRRQLPSTTLELTPQHSTKKGILRKPKYSSSSPLTPNEMNSQSMTITKKIIKKKQLHSQKQTTSNKKKSSAEDNESDSDDNDDENSVNDMMQPIIRDLVVERDISAQIWRSDPLVPSKLTGNAMSVEGYTPRTKPLTKIAKAATATAMEMFEEEQHSNSQVDKEEGGVFIFSSISELISHAKKQPSENKAAEGEDVNIDEGEEGHANSKLTPNLIIEAKLSFLCISAGEYEETKKCAQDSSSLQEDDGLEEEEGKGNTYKKIMSPEDESQCFMGRTDIFEKRLSNSTSGYESEEEDNDESDLLDFLHSEEEEDDDDEYYDSEAVSPTASERLAPRAFMDIWTALTQWITPQAVELIQKYQGTTSNSLDTTIDWTRQVDRSDIGASRCAGLMTILKMHLVRSFRELKVDASNHRIAETRLAYLLRTMDYSRPTPKLNTALWRAMTAIFLHMVLYHKDRGIPMVIDDKSVPESIKAVDMTKEEYRYLTQSSFASLGWL